MNEADAGPNILPPIPFPYGEGRYIKYSGEDGAGIDFLIDEIFDKDNTKLDLAALLRGVDYAIAPATTDIRSVAVETVSPSGDPTTYYIDAEYMVSSKDPMQYSHVPDFLIANPRAALTIGQPWGNSPMGFIDDKVQSVSVPPPDSMNHGLEPSSEDPFNRGIRAATRQGRVTIDYAVEHGHVKPSASPT